MENGCNSKHPLTIFALWYYISTQEKTTNIISFNPKSLNNLLRYSLMGKDPYYNKFKNHFLKIDVEPILVYKYENNSIVKIEDLSELYKNDYKDWKYYASYDYHFPISNNKQNNNIPLKEVLVFLNPTDHLIWKNCSQGKEKTGNYPSFFYESPISLNPIFPDIFLEEGIINS